MSVAGVALFVCATSGCRAPSGMDALLGARAGTPAPASTGSCDFELEGAAGETAFFVLGMLNEYQGRHIVEDDDLVEGCFCDEAAVADVFREAIQKLAEEQHLDLDLRIETSQGCLISYRSKRISDRLNSCYEYRATSESLVQGSDGTYRRTATPSLGLQLFLRSGQNVATGGDLSDEVFYRGRALAYVSGAWARYGRNSEFVFANAQHKASLVAQLLTHLGCGEARLESNVGFIPQTNIVRFAPTDEVRSRLQEFRAIATVPDTRLQPTSGAGKAD